MAREFICELDGLVLRGENEEDLMLQVGEKKTSDVLCSSFFMPFLSSQGTYSEALPFIQSITTSPGTLIERLCRFLKKCKPGGPFAVLY